MRKIIVSVVAVCLYVLPAAQLEAAKVRTVGQNLHEVRQVAFGPLGCTFTTVEAVDSIYGDLVTIYCASTGKLLRTTLCLEARATADLAELADFSSNGNKRITFDDHTVRIWCAKSGRLFRMLKFATPIEFATLSPNGNKVATVDGDNTIRVWNANTGKLVRALRVPGAPVEFAAISPHGKRIVTISRDTNGFNAARLWTLP